MKPVTANSKDELVLISDLAIGDVIERPSSQWKVTDKRQEWGRFVLRLRSQTTGRERHERRRPDERVLRVGRSK
jgi:hypothetical protein